MAGFSFQQTTTALQLSELRGSYTVVLFCFVLSSWDGTYYCMYTATVSHCSLCTVQFASRQQRIFIFRMLSFGCNACKQLPPSSLKKKELLVGIQPRDGRILPIIFCILDR